MEKQTISTFSVHTVLFLLLIGMQSTNTMDYLYFPFMKKSAKVDDQPEIHNITNVPNSTTNTTPDHEHNFEIIDNVPNLTNEKILGQIILYNGCTHCGEQYNGLETESIPDFRKKAKGGQLFNLHEYTVASVALSTFFRKKYSEHISKNDHFACAGILPQFLSEENDGALQGRFVFSGRCFFTVKISKNQIEVIEYRVP